MRYSATSSLAEAMLPAGQGRMLRQLLLAAVGVLLLTLSARVQVPFWPVPMTMQTYVVLVLSAAYGSRLGTATVLAYLAAGALGLPVFAGTPEKGLGLAYMAGPTGGYLAGFVVAAFATGWLAERGWDRSVVRLLAVMIAGHVVIFALGLGWLLQFTGGDLAKAWALGVAPFYVATVAKSGLGALTLPAAWSLLDRR